MPAQKSAKSPKSTPGIAAKAASATAKKPPAKTATPAKKSVAAAPVAKKAKTVPVTKPSAKTTAPEETKTTRAKTAVEADATETPKKRPGRPAKAAGTATATAAAKTPAKRGRKPKAGAESGDGDDTDLSDIESDLEGEVEESTETTTTVEKVKPLRMKISKAKERALMKEFGLDETVLSEEDMAKRRARLKALIKLGKTRGYLTHVEINDHLPDDMVDPEQLEDIIGMINGMGIEVHEAAPDV